MKKDIVNLWTDGSAAPTNPGPTGYGLYIKHDDGRELDGYGGISLNGTNNIGELVGVTKALEYIVLHKPHVATVHTDSKYVLDNIKYVDKWRARKWKTSTGTDVKNKEYWSKLHSVYVKAKKVCNLSLRWVKGHSGVDGNERADILANKGVMSLSNDGNITDVLNDTAQDTTVVNSKPKRLPKVVPLLPTLSGKRWFFLTNKPNIINDSVYIYPTTTYADKVSERNKYVGKDLSNSHFSMLFTKTPEPTLELIKAKFDTLSTTGNLPIIVNLAVLGNSNTWTETVRTKGELTKIIGTTLVDARRDLIGSVVNPPREVFKLNSTYDLMTGIYNEYINGGTYYKFDDITSSLINDKGNKLLSTINTALKFIMVTHTLTTGVTVDTKLNLGLDLPPRNNLAKQIKLSDNTIKVFVVSWVENVLCYRTATLVVDGTDITVYCTPLSNHRFTKTSK